MPQGLGDPLGPGLLGQPWQLLPSLVLYVLWGGREGDHLPYLFGVAFSQMCFLGLCGTVVYGPMG